MTVAIGTGPVPAAAFHVGGGSAPPPTPIFSRVVIEGDSVTSNDPQQTDADDGFYSYAWKVAHPGVTSFVMANGSRTVGGAAYNGDLADLPADQNTLFQQIEEDLALDPDLITAKIGVNDIGSTGVQMATYIQRLKDYGALVRAGGAKFAYCCPTPLELGSAVDQAKLDYANGKWATLFTTHNIRNPVNHGADYYIPMGEHPIFGGTGWSADGVHPSGPVSNAASGQGALFAVYSAAMTTLLDPARVTAAGPYQAVWDAFGPFTDLAVGVPITRRVIVSGLAWAGSTTGVSVTGAGTPSVKTNHKTALAYTYNGDTIDLTLTPSVSFETDTAVQLTIGGETRTLTFRTAANVAPAEYVHGDVSALADGVTSRSMTGLTFATGKAVVFLKGRNTAPSTVTLDGAAMTARQREVDGDNALELFELPVTAGNGHALAITYGAFTPNPTVSYGTITGGTFGSSASNSPDFSGPPHPTPSATVPANGIALAAFLEAGAPGFTPATVEAPAPLIDEGQSAFQGGAEGIALARRSTTGSIVFGFPFGSYCRIIAVYGAA